MALRPYFAPFSNFESDFDDFFFGLPLTFRDDNDHGIGIGSSRRNSLWNSFPETGIYFDEDESNYSVSIDLPGVKVSDITLKVEENGRMVYLSGCRKFRSSVNSDHRTTTKKDVSESKFAKRFTIGENVDIEKLTANTAC